MKKNSSASVRFSTLVSECGRPEILTIWSDPRKDRNFMKLVKSNQIITIVQKPGAKDDARIGFWPRKYATYARFPSPLSADPGTKILGLKYELLSSAGNDAAVGSVSEKGKSRKERIEPRRTERSFTVIVRRTFTKEVTVSLKASDKAEAEQKATERVEKLSAPAGCVLVSDEIIGAT